MHLPWLVTSSNDVNIVMTKALYEDSFQSLLPIACSGFAFP